MRKNGIKELRKTISKKFSDVDASLEEISDIEEIHKKLNKLNSDQLENFISLSKESIADIKKNMMELNTIIKATNLYIKNVDDLVKKIV